MLMQNGNIKTDLNKQNWTAQDKRSEDQAVKWHTDIRWDSWTYCFTAELPPLSVGLLLPHIMFEPTSPSIVTSHLTLEAKQGWTWITLGLDERPPRNMNDLQVGPRKIPSWNLGQLLPARVGSTGLDRLSEGLIISPTFLWHNARSTIWSNIVTCWQVRTDV